MARVRQSGTSGELIVRRLLRAHGIRFQVKAKNLPGTPDLVNRGVKWAIFVHGCFWHAHRGCPRWKIPKSNSSFWREKFRQNLARDERKRKELKKLGYSVLTIWECEIKQETRGQNKILNFINRSQPVEEQNEASKSHIDPDATPKLLPPPRETYHYTDSGRYVSRLVMLNDREKAAKRLYTRTLEYDTDSGRVFDRAYLRLSKRSESNTDGPSVRIADLFSGCGGLSLGTQEACSALGHRFKPLLAIDNDVESLSVYKSNFNPATAHTGDIRRFIDGKLGDSPTVNEKMLLRNLKNLDILLAGPPCQGHSDLNNHTRRKDRRNGLYERTGRFAEIARPTHILIENVPNVVHAHDRALDRTIEHLLGIGYDVDTGIVDLSELGVPQRRRRHVLVASLGKFISVKEVCARYRVSNVRTVRWAISDLEREEPGFIFTEPGKHSKENSRRINYLFEHDFYDLPDRFRPPCHRNGHTYKSMYGRMKYDEPSQTITSGFGCPGQGRFIHPTKRRALTPHEAARLQFFPDYFDFTAVKTRSALANMIGNAVPMKLAYVFCLEFLLAQSSKRLR